jgi:hypothetical protein
MGIIRNEDLNDVARIQNCSILSCHNIENKMRSFLKGLSHELNRAVDDINR